MENPVDFLKRPIAIIGLGLSGSAAIRLLKSNGVKGSDLLTFDEKPGAADFSSPEKLLAKKPKTLVVSPGVALSKDWIRDFEDHGGALTSELALALLFLTTEKIIGVTGALGKSTTVALLEAGLQAFSPDSFVGGNIGRPLADYVADLKEGKRQRAPWVVLELSSYQLENCGNLHCEFGCITYLTPNHLERYPSLEAYYDQKWELVKRTDKSVILNRHGGDLKKYATGRKASPSLVWTDQNDESLDRYELGEAKLLGAHNQDNLALAAQIAREAGWPAEAFEGMKRFRGLPHRMENLGTRQGIRFVNDSKATTIESVKTAATGIYEQMDRKTQLVLMVGGKDKNLPWQELSELKKIQKLRVIFFGESGEKAKQLSGLEGIVVPKLHDAVNTLKRVVQKGDTVLLSPGGTSLDEFKNFEERGKVFQEAIQKAYP